MDTPILYSQDILGGGGLIGTRGTPGFKRRLA